MLALDGSHDDLPGTTADLPNPHKLQRVSDPLAASEEEAVAASQRHLRRQREFDVSGGRDVGSIGVFEDRYRHSGQLQAVGVVGPILAQDTGPRAVGPVQGTQVAKPR